MRVGMWMLKLKRHVRTWLGDLVIAVVRRQLAVLGKAERQTFVGRLLDESMTMDSGLVIEEFDRVLSGCALTEAQQVKLLLRGLSGTSPSSVPQSIVDVFELSTGGKLYYSQEGEDILLSRFFGDKNNGFFVDVGAHHATRFSNTFALYRRGWRGINIDATPGSMESFRILRPEDTNLETAISDKVGPLVLSVFREGALNTFDPVLSDVYTGGGCERTHTVELYPRSLADVLDQYVAEGQRIDLLTVDVEGEDLGVLLSNNWEKYSPEVIVIETLDTPLPMLQAHPAINFLAGHGFVPVSRLYNSVILRREEAICAGS